MLAVSFKVLLHRLFSMSIERRVGSLLSTSNGWTQNKFSVIKSDYLNQSNRYFCVSSCDSYEKEHDSSLVNAETSTLYERVKLVKKEKDSQHRNQTRKKENEMLVKDLLSLDINSKGRSLLDQCIAILRKIKKNEKCSADDAKFLLQFCTSSIKDESPATRSDISERLWKYFIDSESQLDVVHYDKLLRIRLDTKIPEFDPLKFLVLMKHNGVQPSKTTLKFLIAKLCSLGDIEGSKSIMENMKNQRIPITKYVFHSLIIGYYRSNDFKAAKSVINMMRNSGINVSSDTKMICIMELARAKQNYKLELENAIKRGDNISDKDYLNLVSVLLENGEEDHANTIIKDLSTNLDLFVELRKLAPSMIANGGLELITNVCVRALSEDSRHPDIISTGLTRGDFINNFGALLFRIAIKNEYDPKILLECFERMRGNTFQSNSCIQLLEQCAELKTICYGQTLLDEIFKRYGKNLNLVPSDRFLVQRMARFRTHSMLYGDIEHATVEFLIDLGAIGLNTKIYQLSKIVIPTLLEGTKTSPDHLLEMYDQNLKELITKGKKSTNHNPTNLIANSIFRYYLDQENTKTFENAVRLLFTRKDLMRPAFWNMVLARCFLRSQSKDALITVFGLCSSSFQSEKKSSSDTEDQLVKKDVILFQTLTHIVNLSPNFHSDQTQEDILLPVLNALIDYKIGVPEIVTKELTRDLDNLSDEMQNLLTQLARYYVNRKDIWTKDEILKFIRNRKKLHINNNDIENMYQYSKISNRKINRYTI